MESKRKVSSSGTLKWLFTWSWPLDDTDDDVASKKIKQEELSEGLFVVDNCLIILDAIEKEKNVPNELSSILPKWSKEDNIVPIPCTRNFLLYPVNPPL